MTNRAIRSGRLAGLLLLASSVLVPVQSVAAEGSRIEQTNRIPSAMSFVRRHLDVDPMARRLFEIGQRPDAGGMTVDAFDLDTLRATGSVEIPNAQSGVGGLLSAVDELRHRLFVLYPAAPSDDSAVRGVLGPSTSSNIYDEANRVLFGIAAIDTLQLRLIGAATLVLPIPAVPQDRSVSNLIGVKGLSYYGSGSDELLYLATEVPVGLGVGVVSQHAVAIHQVDVRRLLDPVTSASAVDWSYPVPQCPLLMARETPAVLYRSASSPIVTTVCRQGGIQGVGGQPLETPGVVRVRVTEDAAQADVADFVTTYHPVAGNLQWGMSAIDPVAERLFIQIDGSTSEAGIWSFDVPTGTLIGLVSLPSVFATGGTMSLAVDPSRGRLYAFSRPGGEPIATNVLVASTRAESIDQGAILRLQTNPNPVKSRAVVDPLRHRIFMAALEGSIVVGDRLPDPGEPPESSPDDSTTDVAEGAGTNVNFLGGGQAYGARIRWVGGVGGVDRNTNTVFDPPPSELSPQTGGITPPPPAPGTRDVHFARVLHSTLTNGESSARATGAERDLDNTDADMGGFANYIRRWGGPDLADQRWPYPVVECTDFGNSSDTRTARGYGASVECGYRAATVTALALDESLSQGGVVRIAQSRARSGVIRDRRRGVVSVSEAEILGLDLGGVAGIGRVLSRAETWATGRPVRSNGVGAGSRFTREFEDVWVLDEAGRRQTVCGRLEQQQAAGMRCDPEAVRDAINRALGVRARVDLPEPEPARAAGTPGGFEALIIRNPFERANESSVNLESDSRRLEVPAMVITVFADVRVPSRVVISLAGVSAESHYGIYLVSQGGPFGRARGGSGGGSGGSSVSPPGSSSGGGLPVVDPIRRLLKRTFDGLLFALASPGRAIRVFGMLGLLAAPLVLWRRRRGALPPGAVP